MSDWSNNRVVIRRKQPPDRDSATSFFSLSASSFPLITQVNKQ